MRRFLTFTSLLLLSLGTAPVRAAAQSRAQLRVRTSTGAFTFRMGERIPLTLEFTAPQDAHLALIMATYDRSGRMPYESFEVSPFSGATDPLAAYFATGGIMGGMSAPPEPLSSDKPISMQLDMNEWVRFDQPGDYTVTVRSSRVLAAGQPTLADHDHPVVADPLTLHIVPATPEWQRATLSAALKTLQTKASPFAPPPPQTTAAIAPRRFLATPAPINALAADLGDDQPAAPRFALGLAGLPPSLHELAVKTLEQQIANPAVSVSTWLMVALEALRAGSQASPEAQFRDRSESHTAVVQAIVAALPRKQDKAKADTADLLLREESGRPGSSATKAALGGALASTFTLLPEQRQAILLDAQWDALSPYLHTQTLQEIVSLPSPDPGDRRTDIYNRVSLKSAALHRWYEVDPVAATQAAYAQIGSATPSFTAANLWFLPAEPLPHLEIIWAQALLDPASETNPATLAALMTRFGTGAFSSQVATKVRASLDQQACAPQAAMLAYILKADPDLGSSVLHAALQARAHTGCYRVLFDDLAPYGNPPVLTDVAINTINDPDPQTAADALRYLATYGDKRALQPMLERYRTWSAEWSGKTAELQPVNSFTPSANWRQLVLGQALANALLANQGWIPDQTLRAEVLARSVTEFMRTQLEQSATLGPPSYRVNVSQFEGRLSIQIGPYNIPSFDLLEAKLAQFPLGTVFSVTPLVPGSDGERLTAKAKAIFDRAGMQATSPATQP